MGVVNTQTGEELLPPHYFNHIRFIHNTDRFVIAMTLSDGIDIEGRYRWGVFCLYTHEVLTQLVYHDSITYQDGMVVLRERSGAKLVCLTTGEEMIPLGEFVSIFPVGYGVAQVRHSWGFDAESALIEIATGDILADFGEFDLSFGRAINYELRVMRAEGEARRHGTFCLNSLTTVWDDELTPEELSEVLDRFMRPWSPPIVPAHLAHYDQVVILSNGWALVRDGDISRFVEITPDT